MAILKDTPIDVFKNNVTVGLIGRSRLNKIIHQSVRLRIMAVLMAAGQDTPIEFTALRDLLDVTDGNLGAHLQKLESAEYIEMYKTAVFCGRPLTYVTVTELGSQAFVDHASALSSILEWQK